VFGRRFVLRVFVSSSDCFTVFFVPVVTGQRYYFAASVVLLRSRGHVFAWTYRKITLFRSNSFFRLHTVKGARENAGPGHSKTTSLLCWPIKCKNKARKNAKGYGSWLLVLDVWSGLSKRGLKVEQRSVFYVQQAVPTSFLILFMQENLSSFVRELYATMKIYLNLRILWLADCS